MGYDLRGKVAIITGAARGFGKEFALRILDAGAKGVVVCDLLEGTAKETIQELGDKYGKERVTFAKCDVSKKEDWESMWAHAEEKFQYVDILISNAGVPPSFNWNPAVEVMVRGQLLGNDLAMKKMSTKNGGRGGRIIVTASTAGFISVDYDGTREWAGYCAAKTANISVTRMFNIAKTGETEGVKAYALCPSLADTKMFRAIKGDIEKAGLMRAMTVEEVGQGLMDCFHLDLNGGIYAVTPDNPLIDVVNGTLRLFVISILMGKFFNAIGYKPEVIDEKKQLIFITGFMFICFYILQCLFGFLF